MKCSTEGSTGVVLSDFKKEDSPGVTTVTTPWAMVSGRTLDARVALRSLAE